MREIRYRIRRIWSSLISSIFACALREATCQLPQDFATGFVFPCFFFRKIIVESFSLENDIIDVYTQWRPVIFTGTVTPALVKQHYAGTIDRRRDSLGSHWKEIFWLSFSGGPGGQRIKRKFPGVSIVIELTPASLGYPLSVFNKDSTLNLAKEDHATYKWVMSQTPSCHI